MLDYCIDRADGASSRDCAEGYAASRYLPYLFIEHIGEPDLSIEVRIDGWADLYRKRGSTGSGHTTA